MIFGDWTLCLLLTPALADPVAVSDSISNLNVQARMAFVRKGMPSDQARCIMGVNNRRIAAMDGSGQWFYEAYGIGRDQRLILDFDHNLDGSRAYLRAARIERK